MPGAPSEAELEALRASLHRSLQWRSEVLIQRWAGKRPGDGLALLTALRNGGEEQIRQIPFAAQRALAVSRNPSSATGELVSLFEQDPALARALLRVANSAWYRGTGEEVISISAAVQRVGYRAVENLLLENIVAGMMCRPGGGYAGLVGSIWAHMLRTAALAQCIASRFGVDPEMGYTLGLLHDVGKLAIFDYLTSLRHDLRRDLKLPEGFLLDLLGHLHEPVGGRALLRWGLGPRAAGAVAGHHRSPAPGTPDGLTELLFVADRVDLAQGVRFEPPDWEGIWRDGEITADRDEVQRIRTEWH